LGIHDHIINKAAALEECCYVQGMFDEKRGSKGQRRLLCRKMAA